MWKLTKRETYSFIFLLYTNIHLLLNFYYKEFYSRLLINNLIIYLLSDIIWIIIDKKTNISKSELIVHHSATVVLLCSDIDVNSKMQIITIEFSTLMLFIRRITNKLIKKMFISWFYSRIIGMYFWYINYKINYINNTEYLSKSIDNFSYITIYLLSIKWTLDFLKITKNTSYSSILLSLPIYYNIYSLTNQQFVSIFNLTLVSFIHHLIKNNITKSFDELSITFCCLTYLDYNYILIYVISIVSGLLKYFFNISILNQFVYLKTLFYFSLKYEEVKQTSFFIMISFYVYFKYKKTIMWHLSNGIYLTITTDYLSKLIKNM